MPFLIDGYNLLHVTGILGTGSRAGTLERARLALLNFLATTEKACSLGNVFSAKK